MSKTERLFHPRTLVIHPDFKNLEEFIVSIPERFQRNDCEVSSKAVSILCINAQDGDLLPVSAFKGIEDGTWEQGTAQYEKRGVRMDLSLDMVQRSESVLISFTQEDRWDSLL